MSSSRKRNRQSTASAAAALENGQGTIKLSDASLPADFTALRACSSCARGLPQDAVEWDLSGLQVDGKPVSKAAVEAWLACLDSVLAGTPLDDSSKAYLNTATGLQQLLLFADAVGSVGGVLNACLSQLQDLELVVQVGPDPIPLCMGPGGGAYHVGDDDDGTPVLYYATLRDENAAKLRTLDSELETDVRRQVAAQTEALLYVGHMLQLPQLLQTVHKFVFKNHVLDGGVLEGQLHLVFTDRVMAAAVGSSASRVSRDAYATSVLTQPCSAHDFVGLRPLLKVDKNPRFDREKQELQWAAQLEEDFFGCAAGTSLNVQLDLLSSEGPSMRFSESGPWLRAQILLGYGVWDERSRAALLLADEAE